MPLENREIGGQVVQDRVGGGGVKGLDLTPAEFIGATDLVLRAKAAGENLRAEADAQYGAVRGSSFLHQAGEGGQVGVGLVREGVLLAAKDDQGVMVEEGGEDAVAPRAKDLDPGGAFVQGDADLAVMGDGGVFDDGNAHWGAFRVFRQFGYGRARLQGGVSDLPLVGFGEIGSRQTNTPA